MSDDVVKQPESNSKGKGSGGFQTHPENINKNGRPKKEWTMASLIEEALEENLLDSNGSKSEAKKLIAKKLVNMALKGDGDLGAIKEINDRIDGRAIQRVGGEDGGPIKIDVSGMLSKVYGDQPDGS